MNGKLAKKLRKYVKRDWIVYLNAVKEWPFWVRWRLCWWIMFGKAMKKR